MSGLRKEVQDALGRGDSAMKELGLTHGSVVRDWKAIKDELHRLTAALHQSEKARDALRNDADLYRFIESAGAVSWDDSWDGRFVTVYVRGHAPERGKTRGEALRKAMDVARGVVPDGEAN